MKTWLKMGILTIVLGVLAFLSESNGPLGGFWAPNPDSPEAAGVQVPLFIILGLLEAFVSAWGVAFLLFGYPLVKAIEPASHGLTRAAHISIAWVLINWWSHDSLHQHVGFNLNGLLGIEYGYHVTLMFAGVIIAYFFWTIIRRGAAASKS